MKAVIDQFDAETAHEPVVGVSGAHAKSKSVQAMLARVREANARPLMLCNHGKRDAAKDIHHFDAVIILGNDYDLDPNDYIGRYPEGDLRRRIHPKTNSVKSLPESAARDAYEKALIALAIDARMPLFSICGGMHQLNVHCGGTLHQHIPDLIGHNDYLKNAGMAACDPVVPVSIVPGTMLARIAEAGALYAASFPPIVPHAGTVNAFHHQAADMVGNGLIPSAFSDSYWLDEGSEARLIEAVETDPQGPYRDQFLLGVQWHPEFLPDAPSTARILHNVSAEAAKFAQAHQRQHSAQEVAQENILSALPILKAFSTSIGAPDVAAPRSPFGRPTPGRSR